jgi:hypothetical protein
MSLAIRRSEDTIPQAKTVLVTSSKRVMLRSETYRAVEHLIALVPALLDVVLEGV